MFGSRDSRGGYERVPEHEASNEHSGSHEGHERYQSETSSSLPAQVLMYFNVMFSIIYFIMEGSLVIMKMSQYVFDSPLQRIVCAPAFMIWALVEVFRLYFGYSGNIEEMVPQMTAFVLMTVFPQSLVVLYLTTFQEFVFPADAAMGGTMLALLAAETVAGAGAVRSIARKRTAQFHRMVQTEGASPVAVTVGGRPHQD